MSDRYEVRPIGTGFCVWDTHISKACIYTEHNSRELAQQVCDGFNRAWDRFAATIELKRSAVE